ncbi:uncharacterized protein I303_107775 [Kwoniella dejecticola CBS 10117]|uniref:Uncharacterized protein n=1 Tax=Kwoniella dejecticola CBS 10117 TaxID=1296121 RepID=A0A1A5ZVP1_9TREE|nr:uncharacterized protein I303_07780 [Kwoniella dejecticola CBS 10117]OBR81870.1 hypothetical protein I303_07780 [Kwoniella dejecticola CBS 10117]
MSSTTISRSVSPTPSFAGSGSSRQKSYSPSASPAPFLTPNPFESKNFSFSNSTSRPLPRRLLSLQSGYTSTTNTSPNGSSTRSSPYQIPSPISPISPISPSSPITVGTLNRPKRPNMSHRSHSFCASTSKPTYALSSASHSNLSPDKTVLVAPPLERTISSIGSKGNHSPPSQQMQRPFPSPASVHGTPTRPSSVLGEKDINCQSPHDMPSAIPTICVHPSLTPPRPSLSTSNRSSPASRSSSYNTAILTPTTPHDLLFKSFHEQEEANEKDSHDDENDRSGEEIIIAQGVDHLMI